MDHRFAVADAGAKDAQIELLSRQIAVLQEKLLVQEALTVANFGQHPSELRCQQLELQVQILQQENETLKKAMYTDALNPWNKGLPPEFVPNPSMVQSSLGSINTLGMGPLGVPMPMLLPMPMPGEPPEAIESSYKDFMNHISGHTTIIMPNTHNIDSNSGTCPSSFALHLS